MNGEPDSGQLVECRLRCRHCQAAHSIALPAEKPIREALSACSCPTCGRKGSLRLAPAPLPAPPPLRIGKYEEPNDELGDEELVARRPWRN
jgi:pyruvate-formate lyase-activating enzyme